MAGKPKKVAELVTGKLIDVQEGFVATYNWLVSLAKAVYACEDIEVTEKLDGISIKVKPVDSSAKYI